MEKPEKGKKYEIKIIDFTAEGHGIGKLDGFAVFVQGGVIGDTVLAEITSVKANYGTAKINQILSPSENRIKPICPSFNVCGGCSFLHVDYAAELSHKKKKVNDAIKRIGGVDFNIEHMIGMDEPFFYRNKSIYHVSQIGRQIEIGFYGEKTRNAVSVSECVMVSPANEKIIAGFKTYMEENGVLPYDYKTGKGAVKALMIRQTSAGDILVCIIAAVENLPNTAGLVYYITKSIENEEIFGKYSIKGITLNVSKSKNREVMGKNTKFIWGDTFITEEVNGMKFKISSESFFQTNTKMTPKLYKIVKEYAALSGEETVIDAYSGTGAIALSLSDNAKEIIGIELSPKALLDAAENAKLNDVSNVRFMEGDTARVLDELHSDGVAADTVILDPPRGGCGSGVIGALKRMYPAKIIYVSCDPATLARDMKQLGQLGYAPKGGVCIDMFGRCAHIETVIQMLKG